MKTVEEPEERIQAETGGAAGDGVAPREFVVDRRNGRGVRRGELQLCIEEL